MQGVWGEGVESKAIGEEEQGSAGQVLRREI